MKKYPLLLVLPLVLLAACGEKPSPAPTPTPPTPQCDTATVSLDQSSLSIKVGETKNLVATISIQGCAINWSSDHPEIASVDSTGKVTGVSAGTAVISANGAKCNVTVSAVGPTVTSKEVELMYTKYEGYLNNVFFIDKFTSVPCFSVESLFDIYDFNAKYEMTKSGAKYTIKNKYIQDALMEIDFSTGDVIFKNDSLLRVANSQKYMDEIGLAPSDEIKCEKVASASSFTKGNKEFKINLKDFGIPYTYYMDAGLIAATAFLDLLEPSLGTVYYDGGNKVYFVPNSEADKFKLPSSITYSKDFYEYAFNEFSLQIEINYGLKGFSRTMRKDSKLFKYLEQGTVKTFAQYKETAINSKSFTEFENLMNKIINEQLDDGGHTKPLNRGFGEDRSKNFTPQPDVAATDEVYYEVKQSRDECEDIDGHKNYISIYDTDKDDKADILYLEFDSFVFKSSDDKVGLTELLNGTNGINKLVRDPNYEFKDVVIDLSMNGGGSTQAEGYLLSWLCDGIATELLVGSRDGAVSKVSYKYDINGDGVFSELDYCPSNINIYFLIDPYTYSAANSLAFNAWSYAQTKTTSKRMTFVGKQSGGGACSISDRIMLPTGFGYQICSKSIGTYQNDYTKCIEDGVMPTANWEMEPKQLPKRTNVLNPLIAAARSK